MLGDLSLKKLRLSPWQQNLHTKQGWEGNGMWGQGPAEHKQILKSICKVLDQKIPSFIEEDHHFKI
jgi:hypothetical protein